MVESGGFTLLSRSALVFCCNEIHFPCIEVLLKFPVPEFLLIFTLTKQMYVSDFVSPMEQGNIFQK